MRNECEALGRLMAGLLTPSRRSAPKAEKCWMSNGTFCKVAQGKRDKARLVALGYKEVNREKALQVTRARLSARG